MQNDEKSALEMIKALHRGGGFVREHKIEEAARELSNAALPPTSVRRLSKDEVLKHITRPFNLGRPEAEPLGMRGPKRKKVITQYDRAHERRKSLYHKLERLPKSGGAARAGIGDSARLRLDKIVEPIAAKLASETPARNLTTKVHGAIERSRHHPDKKKVRDALRRLGYLSK